MKLLVASFILLTVTLNAQQVYKGRPVVFIANQSNHPELGFVSNFGSAQFFGDAVHWIAVDNSFTRGGLFSGSGGAIGGVLLPGTELPDGLGQVAKAEFNFRSDGATVANVTTEDDKLALIAVAADGGLSVRFDATGMSLPNSGGLPFSRLGEPNAVDGKVAFLGFHRDANNIDAFRGVYVLDGDTLQVIADTNTTLPRIGAFEGSSSQVAYDGTTVAFWGAHGSIQAGDLEEGIFISEVGGAITALAVNGDTIPGTERAIRSFQSPPAVQGDTVYFVAFDEAIQAHLLRYKSGVLETVAKPGDLVAGGALSQIAGFGVNFTNETVYFDAQRDGASVILSKTGDGPLEVAIDNTVIPGFGQSFRVLDAEGDRLVIGERLSLYATIEEPAKPVITKGIDAGAYDPGSSVTLSVEAAGAGELNYEWRLNNVPLENVGPTLTLPNFQAANAGRYYVIVSNANGQVSSRQANIEINSAPVITNADQLGNVVVDAGFPLVTSVSVVGQAPFTYVWRKNGEVVASQVSSLLRILEAKSSDSGEYVLTISNALGEVSSPPISVTVNPAPPNPSFGGSSFVSRFSLPSMVGSLEVNGFREAYPHPAGLAIGFYDSAIRDIGVLLLKDSGDPELILALEEINEAVGAAYTNMFLNDVDAAGRLLVSTTTNGGTGAGVFVRESDGSIRTIATDGLVNPEDAAVTYRTVHGLAMDGERVLFGAAITQQSALLIDEPAGKRVLIPAEAPLPADGFTLKAAVPRQFVDGGFLFTSFSTDFTKYGLFRYAASGEVTALLTTGDSLDGDGEVGQFAFPLELNGNLHVYDFAGKLQAVGDRSATTVLDVGAPVNGGTLQVIRAPLIVRDSQVIFGGTYRDAAGATLSGVFRWDGQRVELVLAPSHIDERRVQNTELHQVTSSGTVWASVTFNDGSKVLVANTGEGGGEPPVASTDIVFERLSGDAGLRFQVPAGWRLEKSADLRPPWQPVEGEGTVDVLILEEAAFFRLSSENP